MSDHRGHQGTLLKDMRARGLDAAFLLVPNVIRQDQCDPNEVGKNKVNKLKSFIKPNCHQDS